MTARAVDYVPEPTVVLMGCRPWPPPPGPDGSCGVCGGAIGARDHHVHCAWSGHSHPSIESRCLSARIGLAHRDRAEDAARKAEAELRRRARSSLTEVERRRIWNGYKGGIRQANPEVTNRAVLGRDFLAAIGQEPDFGLVLDARGHVVGRGVA